MPAPRHPNPPAPDRRLRLSGQADPADAAARLHPAGPDCRVLHVADHGMSLIARDPDQPDAVLCLTVVQAHGSGADRRFTLRSIDGEGLARTQEKIRRHLVAAVIPRARLDRH